MLSSWQHSTFLGLQLVQQIYLRQSISSELSVQSSSWSQVQICGIHFPFWHLNWSGPHWPGKKIATECFISDQLIVNKTNIKTLNSGTDFGTKKNSKTGYIFLQIPKELNPPTACWHVAKNIYFLAVCLGVWFILILIKRRPANDAIRNNVTHSSSIVLHK